MDVLAVLAAVRHDREFVKAGNGPLLFVYATHRYVGHSMSDLGVAYRSGEEMKRERFGRPHLNPENKIGRLGHSNGR